MADTQEQEPAYQLAAARVYILLQEIERIVTEAHWQGVGDMILDNAGVSRATLVPFMKRLQPDDKPGAYHHNIALIEVLTEEPIDNPSLSTLAYQIDKGDWVGDYRILNGASMRNEAFTIEALYALGSEPGFFSIEQE